MFKRVFKWIEVIPSIGGVLSWIGWRGLVLTSGLSLAVALITWTKNSPIELVIIYSVVAFAAVCLAYGAFLLIIDKDQFRRGAPPLEHDAVPPTLQVTGASGREAFITATNIGGPFTLATRAQIVRASRPIENGSIYSFQLREMAGGDASSTYLIATVNETAKRNGVSVKVFGEAMQLIQRWWREGLTQEGLWFDISWTFLDQRASYLHTIATVTTHVELQPDPLRLVVTLSGAPRNERERSA